MAIVFSLAAGILQPLAITVMGDTLNEFGGNSIFFELTPKQISEVIKASGESISENMQSTVLKFVYFGIAILVADYLNQALWVYTSEILCRVCFLLAILLW